MGTAMPIKIYKPIFVGRFIFYNLDNAEFRRMRRFDLLSKHGKIRTADIVASAVPIILSSVIID